MPSRRLTAYVDNDIALKVSRLDLIDEALSSIGTDRASVRLLPSMKFRFGLTRPRSDLQEKLGIDPSTAQRLLQLLKDADTSWEPRQPYSGPLVDAPQIDDGEAVLIEAAAAVPGALLVSGDKVAIQGFATFEGGAALRRQLEGRVVCFEEIMLRLLEQVPFPRLCDHIRTAGSGDVDGVLHLAFRGASPRPQDARDAFRSYRRALARDTGDLLVLRDD